MFDTVLNDNKSNNSEMQVICVSIINELFIIDEVKNLVIDNYFFTGVSGTYEDKTNYTLCFNFIYFGYEFEFYLSYDQLEFYLSKHDKTFKKFILEDFEEERKMIAEFKKDLITTMKKLDIEFNEINVYTQPTIKMK